MPHPGRFSPVNDQLSLVFLQQVHIFQIIKCHLATILFCLTRRQSNRAYIRRIRHRAIDAIAGMQSRICTAIADKRDPVGITFAEFFFLVLCIFICHTSFIAFPESFVGQRMTNQLDILRVKSHFHQNIRKIQNCHGIYPLFHSEFCPVRNLTQSHQPRG